MKKILLILPIFLCFEFLFAQKNGNFFSSLESCGKSDRIKLASTINYRAVVALDTASSTMALNELATFAKQKDDIELQILQTLLKGEYYFNTLNNLSKKYFTDGLALAKKYNYKNLEAQAYHDMGMQYYRDSKYNMAFEYLLKGNYIMKDFGYANYPIISRYLFDLANVYYQFGDFEKSKKLLEEAIKYPSPNLKYGIKIYNTLGLCYREQGNLKPAAQSFIETISLSKEAQENVWIGIASGNLGSVYYKLKQYNDAIPLCQTDYRLSYQSKEFQSAATTLCLLADIYMKKNNLDSAKYFLTEASSLVSRVNDPANYRTYYSKKADYSKITKDFGNACKYLDSTNFYSTSLVKRDFANIKAKAEQKSAVDKYLADLQLLESKKQIQVLTRNGIIIGMALMLIIAALILKKQKMKRANEHDKLLNATEQLNFYVESVKEKNSLINQFEDQLQNINLQHSNEEYIAQLQNYTILTEDDWNEFRRLFEKVHVNFFVKLKQRYPALTQSEVRLMSLIKLNLARKEMADMLGISPDSVKKTRQRIKKRINLDENMDLEEIVFSI